MWYFQKDKHPTMQKYLARMFAKFFGSSDEQPLARQCSLLEEGMCGDDVLPPPPSAFTAPQITWAKLPTNLGLSNPKRDAPAKLRQVVDSSQNGQHESFLGPSGNRPKQAWSAGHSKPVQAISSSVNGPLRSYVEPTEHSDSKYGFCDDMWELPRPVPQHTIGAEAQYLRYSTPSFESLQNHHGSSRINSTPGFSSAEPDTLAAQCNEKLSCSGFGGFQAERYATTSASTSMETAHDEIATVHGNSNTWVPEQSCQTQGIDYCIPTSEWFPAEQHDFQDEQLCICQGEEMQPSVKSSTVSIDSELQQHTCIPIPIPEQDLSVYPDQAVHTCDNDHCPKYQEAPPSTIGDWPARRNVSTPRKQQAFAKATSFGPSHGRHQISANTQQQTRGDTANITERKTLQDHNAVDCHDCFGSDWLDSNNFTGSSHHQPTRKKACTVQFEEPEAAPVKINIACPNLDHLVQVSPVQNAFFNMRQAVDCHAPIQSVPEDTPTPLRETTGTNADLRPTNSLRMLYSEGCWSPLSQVMKENSCKYGKPRLGELDINMIACGNCIGRGGSAVVHRGVYTDNQGGWKLVALKFPTWKAHMSDSHKKFRRETQILIKCPPHKNIVKIIGVVDVCMVLEFCNKGSLYGLLHDPNYCVTWRDVWSIAIATAQGMQHLHRQRIIHRDLKSGNLMVHEENGISTIKIADFGLSRNYLLNSPMTAGLGTWQYSAPEVLCKSNYSEKADVFSYGMVLWESCTRCEPYLNQPLGQVLTDVSNGIIPTMSTCVPFCLQKLIGSCLKKRPEDRPSFRAVVRNILDLRPLLSEVWKEEIPVTETGHGFD